MLTATEIEHRITEHVRQILLASNKPAEGLAADKPLADGLGLDSLEMAGLFIALEDDFKVDPFLTRFSIVDMRSIADLTRAYSAMTCEPATA
ncbi:phosphopantetheine binding protein [Breoghania corrubedonensis]|uniref:Phosphopantetheine binding protein n=1 Tax=Breoghania corrubedonensis TaxID=665038 RepID=A0A2T5VE52_9HYPH|nr:acyl carrier protein [Breoghania corrubedonensis]PTW62035.1 phosphopantetheine binding protein [Breoghania corrubedonensis]